ncbi:hypothetical protein P262_02748 [Cronobacter malonaticus]|uniref:Uncharacterized protein n=3 Tax=Enterobacteriaceae TaxID=543 RepID=V5TYV0_9ENTR|nr:hypothetical protein P262_02748 [Cronobacter malonaticus]
MIFSCAQAKLPKINNKEGDEMERITQAEALDKGLTRFYTGRKCIHGHYSERYTISGECVQCNNERAKRAAQARSQKLKAARKAREAA